MVERIRAGGRVEHHALVVADGVDTTGRSELSTGVACAVPMVRSRY
jgi:hypothetical protein